MNFELPKFGLILIVLGTVGLLAAVIISFTAYSGMDQGALPAASFLSMLIGIAFAFPSMLQDTTGGLSTMRIIVFAVVLLFCTIYMKIGWSIGKMETFTIDQRWIYILGLAFGSKAFQRFGEADDEKKDVKETKETKTTETKEHTETAGGGKGKDTTQDVSH
jgi:hypothetical protein